MSSSVTLVGVNLTRDPELRFTPSGKATCELGVADNRRFQRQGSSEWEEDVSFYDVTTWGDLAEHVASSLNKGDRVVVSGRLQQRSWEANDGTKRSKVEIVASAVAPDLTFATAEVTKIRKDQANGNGSAARPAANRNSGRRQSTTQASASKDYSYEEEPF